MEDHRLFKTLLSESLPAFAADALLNVLGDGSSSAMVSVRQNPLKSLDSDFPKDTLGDDMRQVPWCNNAFFLPERPNFTQDPSFHAGAYYVQDSSSMFPALIADKILEALRQRRESTCHKHPGAVLDLCASPGGKSTHLISILNDYPRRFSLVICNEAVGKRVPPLTDNIAKWGAMNVIATNTLAAELGRLEGVFDVILADVPCSGEGMFRKSSDAVEGWSIRGVQDCAALQRSIIEDVWPALRPGGILVYSTCTYNHLENSDNVRYIAEELGADYVPLNDAPGLGFADEAVPKGLVRLEWGYQFVPGLVPGEGQFFAVLRKHDVNSINAEVGKTAFAGTGKAFGAKSGKSVFAEIDGSFEVTRGGEVQKPEVRFLLDSQKSQVYMLPAEDGISSLMKEVVQRLAKVSPSIIKTVGCRVGEIKAGKIIPDADLALSTALLGAESGRISVFPKRGGNESVLELFCVDIDRETALKFLARENITPQPSWPRGYILLRYGGLCIGFVNNLGTRCNNLHPLMRRIFNKVL